MSRPILGHAWVRDQSGPEGPDSHVYTCEGKRAFVGVEYIDVDEVAITATFDGDSDDIALHFNTNGGLVLVTRLVTAISAAAQDADEEIARSIAEMIAATNGEETE